MKSARRFISLIGWTFLLLFFSCEIEDDFGKPDTSEYFGTKLYTSTGFLMKIIWSEETNEIIAISDLNIAAIDVNTKTSRQVTANAHHYNGSDVLWISGEMLYYLNFDSQLSGININNSSTTESLVDSVSVNYYTTPFSSNNFAFNKLGLYDPSNEPYLFLYDFNTKKETLITSGIPITFSPDGQALLFTKGYSVYYYDLQTKAILPAQFQSYYGNGVTKWTSKGVLFFYQNAERSAVLFNATTNETIGGWENLVPPAYGSLSSSGDKIVIQKEKCGIPYVTGPCSFLKQYYFLVDVVNHTETEMAFGNQPNIFQLIISPAENSIAFIKDNNNIYLAEKKD